jgi:hypothetical protein
MKKNAALLLTIGLMMGLLYLSYRRKSPDPDSPETAVWRIWNESRAGRVEPYLDCFSGAMRAQLETTAKGMTLAGFSRYLKESSGKVKGIAVYGIQKTGTGQASVTVEYTYAGESERQHLNLRFERGRWRVESADSSQRILPLVPYGMPVTNQ